MDKTKNIVLATCLLATATTTAGNGTVTNCPGLTDDPAVVAGKDSVINFSKTGYANSLDTDLGRAMELNADFSKNLGKIKPLHGVNNSPITYGEALPEFTEAGIPFMRTHDSAGAFGGARFIDVSNIFPDMDADENSPASYDFAFTDAYIKGIIASGTKPPQTQSLSHKSSQR